MSNKKEKRILARKLARPLSEEEMQVVAGAALMRLGGALTASSGLRLTDTWSGTGCPESDCDC
jgi:hypothetical protein